MERMLPTSVIEGRWAARGAGYRSSGQVLSWLMTDCCVCESGQSDGCGAGSRTSMAVREKAARPEGSPRESAERPAGSPRVRCIIPLEIRRRRDTWRRTGFCSGRMERGDSGDEVLRDAFRDRRDAVADAWGTCCTFPIVASPTSASECACEVDDGEESGIELVE